MALDRAGDPDTAVFHYGAALDGGLEPDLRRECLHGLGSSLRAVGRYAEAVEVLQRGCQEYPGHPEFPVFLAMAEYNVGQAGQAVARLLELIADGASVGGYARAVREYAADLDAVW